MKCAGCGRPVGRDDHLVAVVAGRLPAGLSPWCRDCFWLRSFGGRPRWFAAFDQPCTCNRSNHPPTWGPCHQIVHWNIDDVIKALRAAPWFIPDGRTPPRSPTFRAYNARGRCIAWSE